MTVGRRLEGKVALVSGAASGIGAETARLFAEHGAAVVVSDVNDEAGEEVARGIADAGGHAIYRHLDTTDEAAWEAVIGAVVEDHGGLDILVNNAGVGGNGLPIDEMPMAVWRQCLAVNLDGVFLGVKHGIRAMKERGGAIINTSSILGIVGLPLTANYAASKGACGC